MVLFFFFSSRRRHTRLQGDWSSDVCSSDLHPRTLGAYFAVVAGTEGARVVYPTGGHLLRADYQSRAAAKGAVSPLHANGGTPMGRRLGPAGRVFHAPPHALKHALLLTHRQDPFQTPA